MFINSKKMSIYIVGIILLLNYLAINASENEKLLTLKELTLNSNLIVKGQIISINCYEKENGIIYSDIRFLVSQTLKGETVNERVLNLTYFGGTINDITTFAVVFPQFQLNQQSILFLNKVEPSKSIQIKYQITGLSQGKFNLIIKDKEEHIKRDNLIDNNLSLEEGKGEIQFTNHSTVSLFDFIMYIKLYTN